MSSNFAIAESIFNNCLIIIWSKSIEKENSQEKEENIPYLILSWPNKDRKSNYSLFRKSWTVLKRCGVTNMKTILIILIIGLSLVWVWDFSKEFYDFMICTLKLISKINEAYRSQSRHEVQALRKNIRKSLVYDLQWIAHAH